MEKELSALIQRYAVRMHDGVCLRSWLSFGRSVFRKVLS